MKWPLFLVIILVTGTALLIYQKSPETGNDKNFSTLKIGERIIKVETASDEESRVKGLSGRDGLPKDEGLLMVFEKPDKYGIWMRDMKFPIDVFWIRENKIVHIEKNVLPLAVGTSDVLLPIYTPPTEADTILEISAGFADENGIKSDDAAEPQQK